MKLKMYQVDAFTNKLFLGNPAAVVILESHLNDHIMQSIASENNLSETAFVSIYENPISIRWFTPSIEVDLCGHATLASARILFDYYSSLVGEEINFDSKSGSLKIRKVDQGLCLNFPADYPIEVESKPLFSEILDIEPIKLLRGKDDYLAVFKNQQQIEKIQPKFSLLKKVDARGLVISAQGDEVDFVSRCFYPETGIKALDNVNLSIPTGSTLGIIGNIGSGKSTLLDAILRLYDPSQGAIEIDGHDLKEYTLSELRDAIGYVPQNAFLFSESIEDNIRFGNPNASDEAIQAIAKKAVVHNNIVKFKEGYKTLLGERGVTLSGGQIQRVSIARALIKDPQILLLDDCLSAVDTDTEEEILKYLKSITKDKTTLIVSHRISSLKHADQIVVFENGKIVQQGQHTDLIEVEGYYKELFEIQQANSSK